MLTLPQQLNHRLLTQKHIPHFNGMLDKITDHIPGLVTQPVGRYGIATSRFNFSKRDQNRATAPPAPLAPWPHL